MTCLTLLALSGCTGTTAEPNAATTALPSVQEASPSRASSTLVRAEPTPYTVPTTPATDPLVMNAPAQQVTTEGRPVAWALNRLPDGGRTIVIRYGTGCDGGSQVEWSEDNEAVRIRVTAPLSVLACAKINYRAIRLEAPLGERQLLHVLPDR